jgi:hypothetical protein
MEGSSSGSAGERACQEPFLGQPPAGVTKNTRGLVGGSASVKQIRLHMYARSATKSDDWWYAYMQRAVRHEMAL